MKIAIVAAQLPESGRKLGGVEVFIHRLANQLSSDPTNEVTVFGLNQCSFTASYQYQPLFSQLAFLKRRKLFIWFVFPWLLHFVQFKDFDVVHFFGDDWFYFFRPQPTIRTMSGSALNEARTATSLKRKIIQYLIYPLEHLSVRLSSAAVGIGTDSQKIYGLDQVIPIGVDQQRFYPGNKTSEPSILFVGTWQGRKRGQFVFEKFVENVLPRVPDAKLFMVSDTCQPHPNVISVTFPDDESLAQLYRESWMFAYPSIYEGFGMPYVEALSSGTAIVTSPNTGAESILCDGEYGIVIDDEHFADAMVDLLLNPSSRTQYEAKGLMRAAQFDWDVIAQDYMQTYCEAINRFSGSSQFAPAISKDV
jgi:phosphatidyl-myo-inositol alpha-mannosyltransferase